MSFSLFLISCLFPHILLYGSICLTLFHSMQLSHSGLSVQFDVFIIAVNRARIENKQIVSWCERKTWLAHFMLLLLLFVFRFSSLRSFMLNAHSGSSSSSVVRMFSDFSLSSSLVWDIRALCVYFETIAYTIHNFAAIDQLLAIRSRETVLFSSQLKLIWTCMLCFVCNARRFRYKILPSIHTNCLST